MNYGQLKTRFTKTLNRRDCTTTQIAEWIEDGIMRAQRLLEVAASEAVYQVNVEEGFDKLLLPSDFLRLISLTVDGVEVPRGTLTETNILAQNAGTPIMFVRDDNALVIGPRPQTDSTIRLVYMSDFTVLVEDADENFLTIIAADILVAGAMVEACAYFSDPRGAAYEDKFIKGINDLNLMSKRDDMMNANIKPAFGFDSF